MKKTHKYVLAIAIVGLLAGLLAVGLWHIAERSRVQDYSDSQTPVGKYDEMVSVDVVRSGDNIWVVDHRSGHLIFELNQRKKADVRSFAAFDDLLDEAAGNGANNKSSASYRSN